MPYSDKQKQLEAVAAYNATQSQIRIDKADAQALDDIKEKGNFATRKRALQMAIAEFHKDVFGHYPKHLIEVVNEYRRRK